MQDEIAKAIDDLLSSSSERSPGPGMDRALWDSVAAAGFDAALVPASLGGSGLALRQARVIFEASGRYAAQIPLCEAILARGITAECGVLVPEGVVTLALGSQVAAHVRALSVPWGRGADWVLVILPEGRAYLLPSSDVCEESPGPGADGECDMVWPIERATGAITLPRSFDALACGAGLRCAQISGAIEAVLELSQRYVTQRRQFGRTLAQFQAIQQQLAVLAEQCVAAQMAAEVACDAGAILSARDNVAAAKVVASEAAASACSIAHAVHGAMGMTAEYPLHRYTRRLHAWRMQYGSERYWARRIGGEMLASCATAWELVRAGATCAAQDHVSP